MELSYYAVKHVKYSTRALHFESMPNKNKPGTTRLIITPICRSISQEFTKTKGQNSNFFQVKSMKAWFVKVGVEGT